MTEETELLKEIKEMLKSLKLLKELELRTSITNEIEKIASTVQRKKMWVLSNGIRSYDEIAKLVGVSSRAVQYFLEDGQKAGLVNIKSRGIPMRAIDWIPPNWNMNEESLTKPSTNPDIEQQVIQETTEVNENGTK